MFPTAGQTFKFFFIYLLFFGQRQTPQLVIFSLYD